MADAQAVPDPLLHFVTDIAARLAPLRGVAAVVLGGSTARGRADERSDIDLGIYYHSSNPLDLEGLRGLAIELGGPDASGAVTEPGEWGPWVNGGAWLEIAGRRVDWLYRDIARVTAVIADCRRGVITADYYLGHPHAFHNYIYLGEVATCLPLVDPGNVIPALKSLATPYPPALRRAIVARYLYDARFMLSLAAKPIERGDVFQVAGCFFRVAAALVQVVLALNERYFLNEKGALEETESCERRPARFTQTVRRVLSRTGANPEQMRLSFAALERLLVETEELSAALPAG